MQDVVDAVGASAEARISMAAKLFFPDDLDTDNDQRLFYKGSPSF